MRMVFPLAPLFSVLLAEAAQPIGATGSQRQNHDPPPCSLHIYMYTYIPTLWHPGDNSIDERCCWS